MAEDLSFEGTKTTRYEQALTAIKGITSDESDRIANLANITAILKQAFGFWWVGFYLVQKETLVLGPFQGPVACTRIAFGKGVCGTAWEKKSTLVVPDVHRFPGHIACSGASKSEIVVPLLLADEVIGVLDVDSELLNHFDDIDQVFLEKIAAMAAHILSN